MDNKICIFSAKIEFSEFSIIQYKTPDINVDRAYVCCIQLLQPVTYDLSCKVFCRLVRKTSFIIIRSHNSITDCISILHNSNYAATLSRFQSDF